MPKIILHPMAGGKPMNAVIDRCMDSCTQVSSISLSQVLK
jgi:hypothetical protein